MREADFIVDVGPGAGIHGGEIVVAGTPDEVAECKSSVTGDYLSGYSAARSSPQPLDLCLLSPAISAYSAMRCAPDRHLRSTVSLFISDYQSVDQHLSTTL